eukprot:1186703-Prorocentrum_minimum.AAC.1
MDQSDAGSAGIFSRCTNNATTRGSFAQLRSPRAVLAPPSADKRGAYIPIEALRLVGGRARTAWSAPFLKSWFDRESATCRRRVADVSLTVAGGGVEVQVVVRPQVGAGAARPLPLHRVPQGASDRRRHPPHRRPAHRAQHQGGRVPLEALPQPGERHRGVPGAPPTNHSALIGIYLTHRPIAGPQ